MMLLGSVWASFQLGQLVNIFFIRFTVYGLVLTARKVLQWYYAYRNIKRMNSIVRTPLFEFLENSLENEADLKAIRSIRKKHRPFDVIRSDLKRALNIESDEWKNLVRQTFPTYYTRKKDTVGGVAPAFGLQKEEVTDLFKSVVAQTYAFDHFYIVQNGTITVDGEQKRDEDMWQHIQSLIREYQGQNGTRFHAIYRKEGDKRGAMNAGFKRIEALGLTFTINVDGDTILDEDAVANAVRVMLSDPEIACGTGDVRLINPDYNILTMLTAIRYFNAFNIERSAQSWFNQMTVLSGPFLIYRTKFLKQIRERWFNQTFMKSKCTYGDDRHLATLALMMGWKVVYLPDSIVWTEAPVKLGRWIKQQLRWSRSAWRENWLLFEFAMRNPKGFGFLHWFIYMDLVYLTLFPFVVLAVIISVMWLAITTALAVSVTAGLAIVIPYVITIIMVNWIFNSGYGLQMKRESMFLLSPLYVFLWFLFLIPLKFVALFTVNDTGWSGRGAEGVATT